MGSRCRSRATPLVWVAMVAMAVVLAENGRSCMALNFDDVVMRARDARNWAANIISGEWSISEVKEGARNSGVKIGFAAAFDVPKQASRHDQEEAETASDASKHRDADASEKTRGVTEGSSNASKHASQTAQQGASDSSVEKGQESIKGVSDTLKQATEKAGNVYKDAMHKVGEAHTSHKHPGAPGVQGDPEEIRDAEAAKQNTTEEAKTNYESAKEKASEAAGQAGASARTEQAILANIPDKVPAASSTYGGQATIELEE